MDGNRKGGAVLERGISTTCLQTYIHTHIYCKYSPMPRITIRNDRTQVINRRLCRLLGIRHAGTFLLLAAVVKELRGEKLVHLVGDGVHGVVSKIGAGLIRGGGGGGALPPGDIDSGDVFCHLCDLHGVEGAEGVGAFALGGEGCDEGPELLCLLVGGGFDEEGRAEGDHVLCGVRKRGCVSVWECVLVGTLVFCFLLPSLSSIHHQP